MANTVRSFKFFWMNYHSSDPRPGKTIYKRRPELPKSKLGMIAMPEGFRPLPNNVNSEEHSRQKRLMKYAFSDRALGEHEYLLHKHADTLVSCLAYQTQQGRGGSDVDICNHYYPTTFDIIGDLCFGESFSSLVHREHHYWLAAVFTGIKIGSILTAFDHFMP